MSKIVHAAISENGTNGWGGDAKAGDQTGGEVCIRDFYNKPWNIMLRYPDKTIAGKAAEIAAKLAKSNLVGYDQSQRNTLYKALKAANFDVDKYIASGKKTETDCSAFVYACFCCVLPALRSDENAPRTATMRAFYTGKGFSLYTDYNHLHDVGQFLSGDILCKEGAHTAMEYIPGATAPTLSPTVDAALTVIARDVIAGNWGNGTDRKEKLYRAIQDKVNALAK